MKKTERLYLRTTPELKENLKELAVAEGKTVSDYIEGLVIHAIAEETRMRNKIETEVKEKYPDLDEIERFFVVHERLALRKSTIRNMDRLQLMMEENRAKQGEG